MILVQVNRIRAAKKLVLYFRFLESSARQISECKGQFEQLPESCQTASLNIAFASDYVDIKEVREFGFKIREYFKFSPAFYAMSQNLTYVDPDLKTHCEIIKYQRGSNKDVAEYYISYMDRMGKEADPKVQEKLKKNQYDTNIVTVHANIPGMPGYQGYMPPSNGAPHQAQGYQPFQPSFPPHPTGGQNPFPGNPPINRPPPGGTTFGGAPGGHQGFGGANQYNPFMQQPQVPMNAGYQMNAQAGQQYNYGQQPPAGSYNPFTGQEFAKSGPTPSPYAPTPFSTGSSGNGYGQPVQGGPANQFDDIFDDPKVPKNVGFGGDKKSAPGESHDDFMKQLDDLKKL